MQCPVLVNTRMEWSSRDGKQGHGEFKGVQVPDECWEAQENCGEVRRCLRADDTGSLAVGLRHDAKTIELIAGCVCGRYSCTMRTLGHLLE